jgi:hypothetical protein
MEQMDDLVRMISQIDLSPAETIDDILRKYNLKVQMCYVYSATPIDKSQLVDLIEGKYYTLSGSTNVEELQTASMVVFQAKGANYPFDANGNLIKLHHIAIERVLMAEWSSYRGLIYSTAGKLNPITFIIF